MSARMISARSLRGKYLSEVEVRELEWGLKETGGRDALMIGMLLAYGMRASELLGIRVRDVNEESGSVWVEALKGGVDREIPLKPEHLRELVKLGANKAPDEFLFPIGYNRLGEIWRRYRPGKRPLHSLRHTCAIEAFRRCRDVLKVKRLLGHRSITTTMVYQDFVYGLDELREALGV